MQIGVLAVIALLAVATGGCSSINFPGVYRIEVPQGNVIHEEMVAKLKPGMTRRQVRFIMGTPLIEDTFNKDRWDYVYTRRRAREVLEEAQLSVFFENDRLVRFSGYPLDANAADNAQAGVEPQ